MRQRSLRSRLSAFSLVEMLVVIGIIAAALALLLVVVIKAVAAVRALRAGIELEIAKVAPESEASEYGGSDPPDRPCRRRSSARRGSPPSWRRCD